MPDLDPLSSRRQIGDAVPPVLAGDREGGGREHHEPGPHPRVHVAADFEHAVLLQLGGNHVAGDRHGVVHQLHVTRLGTHVVQRLVAIDHVDRAADGRHDHVGNEGAMLLIELLLARLDVLRDRHVDEPDDRVAHAASLRNLYRFVGFVVAADFHVAGDGQGSELGSEPAQGHLAGERSRAGGEQKCEDDHGRRTRKHFADGRKPRPLTGSAACLHSRPRLPIREADPWRRRRSRFIKRHGSRSCAE